MYVHWRHGHSIITTRHDVNRNTTSAALKRENKLNRWCCLPLVSCSIRLAHFIFVSRDAFFCFSSCLHLFYSLNFLQKNILCYGRVFGEQWDSRCYRTRIVPCVLRNGMLAILDMYGKSGRNVNAIILPRERRALLGDIYRRKYC